MNTVISYHEVTPQRELYESTIMAAPRDLESILANLGNSVVGADNPLLAQDRIADCVTAWQAVTEVRAAETPTFRSALHIARAMGNLGTVRQLARPEGLVSMLSDVATGQNIGPGSVSLAIDLALPLAKNRSLVGSSKSYQKSAQEALQQLAMREHPQLRLADPKANRALHNPGFLRFVSEAEFVRFAGPGATDDVLTVRAQRLQRAFSNIPPQDRKHVPYKLRQVVCWSAEVLDGSRSKSSHSDTAILAT